MKRPRHSGKSLIELIVVISIFSVVMGLSATSLTTLFRLRNQLSRDREQGAALSRLATRLRQDAHEAVSASLDDGCIFKLPDGRMILYAYSAPNIVREVHVDDKTLHRDRFLLPKSATAAFERDGDSSPELIRLIIRPIEVQTRRVEIPRAATIEAAVGLNASLLATRRLP